MVSDICGRLNLVSAEAIARVGQELNDHYRRVTATIGLEPLRYVTRSMNTTLGGDTVTFTGIEKIDRVFETSADGHVYVLKPVSVAQLRESPYLGGDRYSYCVLHQTADSITIQLPGQALGVTTLYADGWSTLANMAGSDRPAIPESFHSSILCNSVIGDEYLRKEKPELADRFFLMADAALKELRFTLADAPPIDWRQGGHVIGTEGGGNTGGPGDSTITGYITFAPTPPSPPFGVLPGAGLVENLDADKLDGQHGPFYLDRANHTGTDPFLDLPEATIVAPPADTARLHGIDVNGYTQVEVMDSAGRSVRLALDNVLVAKVADPAGVQRGQPVYVAGASGANPLVALARSDALATMPAVGLSLDTGATNAFVRVLLAGRLEQTDTSAWAEGVSLFVSPTVAGGLTTTLPTDPNLAQRVAFVLRSHATQGDLLVLTTAIGGGSGGEEVIVAPDEPAGPKTDLWFDTDAVPVANAAAVVVSRGITLAGVITTGLKGLVRLPFNATIVGWSVMADIAVADLTFGVAVNAPGTYPPTTSIVAAAPPKLAAQSFASDAALTGWTKTVNAGDVMAFRVSSITGTPGFAVLQLDLAAR